MRFGAFEDWGLGEEGTLSVIGVLCLLLSLDDSMVYISIQGMKGTVELE